ncbi:hypothetical protein BCR36DRAFT_579284 [Piromyces finnis]|uniref:Protein NO VEIN C-terminal domain-containing protein n=1 Tax=Piromyces finnis TaxID=1754191 RepID=A0A1Y1VQ39_9FUNG|nr:hypothetical protein BCR36DRAFT_579284 [Piromyces finnis]|eukprot:ORX61263.1 hypothetical protein BCR36DRAFT_579284 [Piromyces finnis]
MENNILENTQQNPFDDEKSNIFGHIYLANVRNRLRELENPNDIDCKRWIWELVQNAKDSISGRSDRTSVDIEIIISGDTYTFRHNGSPFTISNLTALLYKYSSGKTNDCESTGRFGTGFLTTHCLSKNVKISGEVILRNKAEPQGFTVTMYREGEDEQLLEGLKNTEKSFRTPIEVNGWTTYVYEAVTKRNKEAGDLGIKNFKENISKVMLFCSEINSIQLNENGNEYSITRDIVIENLSGGCQMLYFHIHDNHREYTKKFLCNKVDEPNELLSQKFGKKRNLRLCCAIQLDEKNDILIEPECPCLFCSLPLVGSEKHVLPFIINSPDFEPDSERQAILLEGNKMNEKTQKLSDPGVNMIILHRAQEMYVNLLKSVCCNGVGKRYHLTRGLCSTPCVTNFFDKNWYKENFMQPMRTILHQHPIVWNGNFYSRLTEVYLPKLSAYYNKEVTKDDTKQAYHFISKLYIGEVPEYEESILIENNIWKKDSRLKFISIEECVCKIEEWGTMDKLNTIMKDDDAWAWLDDFLVFIKKHHPEYLENHAIIPNMNSTFVKLTKNLASSKNVSEDMIHCIEKLGLSWKDNHIHKSILNYTSGTDHDTNYAVSKIRDHLTNWSKHFLTLMHYIPDDQDQEFIQKRKAIYEFCCTVWSDTMEEMKIIQTFPKELWNGIDDIIFKHLIKEISNYGKLDDHLYTIDFMIQFLKCVSKYYPDYRHYRLFPNQNGLFCTMDKIYEDNHIPDIFKECLKVCFDDDIKKELLDPRMSPINYLLPKDKKSIYSYNNKLKYYFELPESCNPNAHLNKDGKGLENIEYIKVEKKELAATYLIRILPEQNSSSSAEQESSLHFDYTSSASSKQRKLYHLYQLFTKTNDITQTIKENDQNEGIWKYSNTYIYRFIRNEIEKWEDLDSLSKALGKSDQEILTYLKQFIHHYSREGRVVLNQNNHFCRIDELQNEECFDDRPIPEVLKDISKLLGDDVKNCLVHPLMGKPCIKTMFYPQFCLKIDKMVKEWYEKPQNHSNSEFKEAAGNLIEIYFNDIGNKKANEYFPLTYNLKDPIILNVIYDKETRQNITKLGQYGKDAIKKLVQNPNIIKKIISGELDDNLFSSITHYDDHNDNVCVLRITGYSKITKFNIPCNAFFSFKDIIEFLHEYVNYLNDFKDSVKKEIIIYGEIYIYEYLCNSGLYKNVRWNRLSHEESQGEIIEYNGKKYCITPEDSLSHCGIIVETNDHQTIYVDVKSTNSQFNSKIPLFFDEKKIYKMKDQYSFNQYVSAIVYNVKSKPLHFFISLRDNLYQKIIQ